MIGEWQDAKLAIAKLVAPMSLWMAAGWAAYPYAIEYIARQSGELGSVDLPEIRGFSLAAIMGCIVVAALSAGYYFMMRGNAGAHAPPISRCPYCDTDNQSGSASCATCGRRLA
jgi:hypothetical protein